MGFITQRPAAALAPPDAGETPRKGADRSRALSEAFAATLAMLAVGVLAMTGLYRSAANAVKEELHDDLIRVASAAASVVDADLHRGITDPKMLDGELYNTVIAPLRRIREGTPGVKYVYTAVLDAGDVRFVLDAAIPGDHDNDGREDRSLVWEEYNDAEPAMRTALGSPGRPGVATASPEPYTDEWGTFVTGYAPFCDSSGTHSGVVGVDVMADVYLARLAHARQTALLGMIPAALSAGLIGAGYYAARRRELGAARTAHDSRTALVRAEARARTLIEGSDVILWEYVPHLGVFTYVSPQAERLGYPLADWFNQGFWEAHLHPDDRESATAYCREQSQLGRDHRLQYRMVKPDGSVVWVDDMVTVARNDHGAIVLRGVLVDITERKEAENRLREMYTRLQKIATQVPGVVYQYKVRPDGSSCFPYASQGIRDIYRVEPEEVRTDASHVFDIIHPDDLAPLRHSIRHSAETLSPWRSEYRVRFADGDVRWLLGNAIPQRESDGSTLWHGFICDITERKESDERLIQANKRFDLARRSVRIGIWEWNVRTGELDWDDGMLELFEARDASRDALQGVWGDRVHPEDGPRVAAEARLALAGAGDFDTRYRVVQRDGSTLWLASHGVVVRDANGDAARLVGLSIDITRQVNDNDALARARDQAEAANRAKSQFLANMSHEIRTPLTAILGYADLLRDDGDATKAPPHRIQLIETIRSAGSHLLEIINDILDLSKIEAGRMSVERVELGLPEIVAGVETLLRPKADAKGIALHVSLDSPIPDRIVGDPTRIRQVLVNLAGNAVKFTEAGSVAIRVSAGERLRFDVEDTGAGMSPEQSARLFEAFTQADATVTRRHGGTGLGLVICRRLAHLMGGEVTLVRTAPEQGSVFRFELPLERAPGSTELRTLDAARATARPVADAGVRLRARVLLAEDGPDNQRLITFYLKRAGAEIEVAENGRLALDAFERARASGSPFDLVITDVQMPVMDGYTFARALRDAGHAVPIVALTAHAMAEDREKCLHSGCNGYATKPIDARALLRLCEGLVGAATLAG